ncbi:MAG: BamA/TamA family outer membrane protein, partial [Saprospiraceae bacterium]
HKHVIDQEFTLRARLFDLWLGDWDRHDDQVRWASFKEKGMTVYRPIPRDRDQVFFKNDGLLDHLASRPYFNPPLRKFDDEIDFVPGLMWAGKHFDRSFLNELTEEDFVRVAQELQNSLTDNVIDAAFRDWPSAIDKLDGEDIRGFLRIRRSDLLEYAKEYYRHLSKEVTVPASDDRDRITIDASNNDHLLVKVERFSQDGTSHPFYQRTLDDQHTKELRVFGLGKSDTISVIGDGNPAIKVRLIGGSGKDVLINNASKVKLIAYDDPEGMSITGDRVSEHLNDKPFNNTYDRTDWKINRTIHFPLPAYYTDEGFGLTYNLWSTRFGFRSNPFKSNHALALSYFFNTGAFIGQYDGLWPGALGDLDFGLNAYFTGPTFTQYYYSLGNAYVDYGEKNKYHIVKGSQIRLAPSIEKRFGFGSRIFLSPNYQFMNLEDSHDEPRFVYTSDANLSPEDFGQRHYVGITAGYGYQRLDNIGFPSRGGEISLSVGGRTSLVETGISHGLLSAEGALYIPFNSTATVVIATHVQADKILGDYEFFHALTLGGPDKLRGFRRDRFAGDARFLHASDLRFKLFQSRGAVPFSLGLYGSLDYGRVWYEEDDETADGWHTAYGGGLYVAPLGLAAFRLGYMIGEDDRQINLGGALRF